MATLILTTHSILRYLILAMLIWSLVTAWSGWKGDKAYGRSIRIVHQATRILLIVQMLLGIGLYYLLGFYRLVGKLNRLGDQSIFFTVVHVSMMLLAIILINLGYGLAMKARTDKRKYRRIAVFYSIGTFIIFMAIPWPFMHSWGTWL